jgi:hypothetical protein
MRCLAVPVEIAPRPHSLNAQAEAVPPHQLRRPHVAPPAPGGVNHTEALIAPGLKLQWQITAATAHGAQSAMKQPVRSGNQQK